VPKIKARPKSVHTAHLVEAERDFLLRACLRIAEPVRVADIVNSVGQRPTFETHARADPEGAAVRKGFDPFRVGDICCMVRRVAPDAIEFVTCGDGKAISKYALIKVLG
jgi:hypothetical protein